MTAYPSETQVHQQKQARVWKTAVDPKSGRTYYYDAITRETQWRKPLELATEEERKAMTRKEKKQKDFFSQMEANILKNLAAGAVVPVKSRDSDEERDCIAELVQEKAACGDVSSNMSLSSSSLKPKSKLSKPQMVRTISSMDNNVLAELTRVEKGGLDDTKRRVSPTSVITGNENSFLDSDSSPEMMRCDILNLRASDSEEEEDRAIEELRLVAVSMSNLAVNEVADDACRYSGVGATPSNLSSIESPDFQSQHKLNGCKAMLAKPSLLKRNTCGTLYVGSTMSAPDKDATIKCVCGVFRAHLIQSKMDLATSVRFEEYDIFIDRVDERETNIRHSSKSLKGFNSSLDERCLIECEIPSLNDITNFYRDVFSKSQMECDTIIMSLIYVERLMKETNGGVRPRVNNWRSMLFSSMILSSKVWDDLSMWNADFSQCVACPAGVSFPVQRINELERAVLSCLKYNVKVAASEYAKYYFLLRSMLIRSGLADKEDLNSLSPLDVEGARLLELRSSMCSVDLTNANQRVRNSPGSGTSNYPLPTPQALSRRVKSLGDARGSATTVAHDCDSSELSLFNGSLSSVSHSNASIRLSLEQLVQM